MREGLHCAVCLSDSDFHTITNSDFHTITQFRVRPHLCCRMSPLHSGAAKVRQHLLPQPVDSLPPLYRLIPSSSLG